MLLTDGAGQDKEHRVTVRLSEAEMNRLDALCAPTSSHGTLKRAAVMRAALGDLTAPGFTRDSQLIESNFGSESAPCERVHLDEATAHKLIVELGREGRNLMQIVKKINSHQYVANDKVKKRLDALLALWHQLERDLGASSR